MKQPEPIHALEKDRAIPLIGCPILYANDREGLGNYGTLIGWSDNGFFVVTPDCRPYTLHKCVWIVENRR